MARPSDDAGVPAAANAATADCGEKTVAISYADTTATDAPPSPWRRAYDVIYWTPPNCRWNPEKPPTFSMPLNILFGCAGCFTVANLYYSHPILATLAKDFGVPYDKVSEIPTLAQAGYATGLLFLCPLGDLLKRRPFVLTLVLLTATVSIGLCVVPNLAGFSALSFIVGVMTVTPQLMLPLVGDLAPPQRRAAALSIVVAGMMLGMLIARLLSGIIANYASWRDVYWMSVGVQYVIFGLLWAFMPDYPATNTKLNYFSMLWSILTMLAKHPVLVQACAIGFFMSATFTSFWTDLTFLLSSPPYNYSTVVIGLFALIGIASICTTPFYARIMIDRFVPLFSTLLGLCWLMLGICIGAYTGSFTIAGPIVQAWLLDFGIQTAQIANRSAIYAIEPRARNRVNVAYMLSTFLGQIVGTSVGPHLYDNYKPAWVVSQSYSVACIGAAFLIAFARGPWEEGWFGWSGGWSVRKKNKISADGKAEETANHLQIQRAMAGNTDPDADVEKGLETPAEPSAPTDALAHTPARDDASAVNAASSADGLETLAAESSRASKSAVDDGRSDKSDPHTSLSGSTR